MSDSEREVEVCECEKCGNEAEMIVTCKTVTIKTEDEEGKEVEKKQEKKSFKCEECGHLTDTIVYV